MIHVTLSFLTLKASCYGVYSAVLSGGSENGIIAEKTMQALRYNINDLLEQLGKATAIW